MKKIPKVLLYISIICVLAFILIRAYEKDKEIIHKKQVEELTLKMCNDSLKQSYIFKSKAIRKYLPIAIHCNSNH
jgi:hypothetical protein